MKKLLSIALATVTALSLAACGNTGSDNGSNISRADTMTVTHTLGETTVPYNPEKVVVLDYAALDVIDALELGDRVIGIPKTSTVNYLSPYLDNENIANMGSLKEVDMEALNSIDPDLIIIGGRLESEYANISKIAPTISYNIQNEKGYMNSFNENATVLASIFGKQNELEGIMHDFNARIEDLTKVANEKTAIVSLVTKSSVSTLGNDSRCSIISNEIGFNNLTDDVNSTHGDSASFELLLQKNPDYLFVLDRDTAIGTEGAQTAKEVIENELVMKTDAYKNGNIIYLTPDVWYLAEGGITATDLMLKDIESGIVK